MNISPHSNASRRVAAVAGLDLASLSQVARVFAVLAEPTRLQILQALAAGPLYVGELVERLGARQANVSKQLGILHQAGLVERERHGALVRYAIGEPLIFELCSLVCGKLRRDAEARIAALPPEPRAPKKRR
jgi:DNA-binding transcriptional ArsR family regulator